MGNKIETVPHSRPTLGAAEAVAAAQIVRRGMICQGEKVAEFEKLAAKCLGKKYGVAVSSGVSALHLALRVLGVGECDEVIVPSYTCDALLHPILYLWARPVIADVHYPDGNLTAAHVKRHVSSRTKAVIVTHSLGSPARVDDLSAMGIPVIEDCATSFGARYKKRPVGGFGAISVSSFYATKMLTTGEGGIVCTDDPKAEQELRELRSYLGFDHFRLRYNYKLTDIAAAIGIEQLRRLDGFIKRRRNLARIYDNELRDHPEILLPQREADCEPVCYRYIVRLKGHTPSRVIEAMKRRGICCGKGVLVPLHRLMGLPAKRYVSSERLYSESVSLPIYPSLTDGDVKRIASEFISCLSGAG